MKKHFLVVLLCLALIALTAATALAEEAAGSVQTAPGAEEFAVTLAETTNGQVTADKTTAAPKAEVTLTVAPDKGYTLETLIVTEGEKELELTAKEDGTYSFLMPTGAVQVAATFMEDNTMLNYFVDVKAADWYYDAVLWGATQGVTSGTDEVHFSPEANCTRAQMITFLWRAVGSPEPKAETTMFTDVDPKAYYFKALSWAYCENIANGVEPHTFGPDVEVTREQLAAFLYRYAQSQGNGFTGTWMFRLEYADADAISDWADEAMHWCVMKEIVNGVGENKLAPQGPATRAQIVTMLHRVFLPKAE